MSTEINVPTLPESIADATVANWHKKPGDSVTRGENVVDIETDKVVLEVPAPTDGILGPILQETGATVIAGQSLSSVVADASNNTDATISTESEAPKSSATTTEKNMDIPMPQLPESVADATIAAWHKNVGDYVKRGENLVDVETDKVVLEVPASQEGVLSAILAPTGETVTQSTTLGTLTLGEKAPNTAPPSAAASATNSDTAPQTGPASRAALKAAGLSAAEVSGSGKNGRILAEDVQQSNGAAEATPKSSTQPTATSGRTQERVPMTRLRKTIASRLLAAKTDTAMLTTFNEVNMQPVIDLRTKYKANFEKTHGVKLGFMSIFVKAATEALKRFPDVNASIDGDDIIYHGFCDVGIAVSSDRGLVVPVLRDAQTMSLAGIESNIASYAQAARDGKLSVADMTGGTFTITNGGVFGSLLSTPILNPPQSAILGMHATQDRPVVVNGEIVIRPMMYLALSYDHRIVDGQGAVTFLKTIKELIEDPARILLEL